VLYNNNNIVVTITGFEVDGMDKKNGKKNLFILNVTGQAQKTSRVQQRRLHARAQVHSTVGTRRLGIAPVRYGVVVRASATTSPPPPPPGNGKENKKQTNRSRQHSQTILSVTTVHHRLRARTAASPNAVHVVYVRAPGASCIPYYFHAVGSKVLVGYTPISLRPPTHPRVARRYYHYHSCGIFAAAAVTVFYVLRRKSNHRHPSASYEQNIMSCSRRRHHHY